MLALLLAGCAFILAQRVELGEPPPANGPTSEKPPETAQTVFEVLPEDIRDVTPEKVLPAAASPGAKVERLPAIKPPPPPPKPPKPDIWYNPLPESAGAIRSGEMLIELAGIKPLPVEAKCKDGSGREWPCGMLARTSLRSFVRSRPIECDPSTETRPGRIVTRCRLSGYDISAWVVWQGWATPKSGMFPDEYAEAQVKGYGQFRSTAPGY